MTSDDEGRAPPPPARWDPPDPPARPGASVFTIEGRAAPGLFVVGWLAVVLGAGALFVGFQVPRSLTANLLILGGLLILSVGLVAAAGAQAIERRARGAAYAGPSPFLVLAASIAIANLAAGLVALAIRALGGSEEGPVTTFVLLATVQVTYLAVTRLLVVGTGALTWAEMGYARRPREALADLVWGAWFALPVIGLTLIVVAVVTRIVPEVPDSPLPPTGTTSGLLLNLLGGAVLVPLGEEMVFRGVATTAWRRAYGPGRAIVQGALFFAAVHVLQVGGTQPEAAIGLAAVAFLTRIPVALALGWLFDMRHSIWASIGLHAAFNGILIVLSEIALRNGFAG
jgi:membrane protease YdiL (CAAX protease family)